MTQQVLVLNASYEPHQLVSLPHAIKMLVRQVAVIEDSLEGMNYGPFPHPKVLRLVRYVYVKITNGGQPRYSRDGVFRRDNHKCLFCGKHATTIDHVTPKSRGGKSTWLNVVAACRKCNEKKADRTPQEAAMSLRYDPYVPSYI